jgi:hypothetical protein
MKIFLPKLLKSNDPNKKFVNGVCYFVTIVQNMDDSVSIKAFDITSTRPKPICQEHAHCLWRISYKYPPSSIAHVVQDL